MLLGFEPHCVKKGTAGIVFPDMFPAIQSRSDDFEVSYCLMERDFAEGAMYGVPNLFYDCPYLAPMIDGGEKLSIWARLLEHVAVDYAGSPYRREILKNTVHSICLVYYELWQRQYGNKKLERERKRPEQLAQRFYNLVFEHFSEQRDIGFYADRLCITSNYLAMIVRQICQETPKQAIDRLVVLEMKYILRNTSMTAAQMAQRLHFPDTSYMCRYFRKRTGMSLSEYRNREAAK